MAVIDIPSLMFGATSLGNLFQATSNEQKRDLIAAWFEHHPTPVAIDTAGKYGAGMALEVLGRELKSLGIKPDDVVLNNKLGWRQIPLVGSRPSFEPDAWIDLTHDAVQDISYDGILRCWEQGCELLNGYVPQLASIHDPDDYLFGASDEDDRQKRLHDILTGYEALKKLKSDGVVKAIGVGAKHWPTIRMLTEHCEFDWIMLANSFTLMNHPPELIAFLDQLKSKQITVINSALFQGGFVVGSEFFDYRKIDPNDPADQQRLKWREAFHNLCQRFETTPFAAAVAFGRSHPAIKSIALSTARVDRIPDLVAASSLEFDPQFWLAAAAEGLVDARFASSRTTKLYENQFT
jgi:D-threo-aldose 1-dehydrogenase